MPGLIGQIQAVETALGSLLPTDDSGDDQDISKAQQHLVLAQASAHWIDDAHPSDGKPFAELRRAAEDLGAVQSIDVSGYVSQLGGISRSIAQIRIQEFEAEGGDPNKVAAAESLFLDAQNAAAGGDVLQAIDLYKAAWSATY